MKSFLLGVAILFGFFATIVGAAWLWEENLLYALAVLVLAATHVLVWKHGWDRGIREGSRVTRNTLLGRDLDHP